MTTRVHVAVWEPKQVAKNRQRQTPADRTTGGLNVPSPVSPDGPSGRGGGLPRRLAAPALGLASVVLLSFSFTPWDAWPLAYVALAPWLMALNVGPTRRWELLWAWLSGLLFWAANLYWLWWITLIGYGAAVFYLSLYWLVAGVVLRASMRRGWPIWIVLPIVWVALEYARTYVVSGFPWFFLAHSQYARASLIQVSDVTGQYGVSFFVGMVNGAVVDLLIFVLRRKKPGGRPIARVGIAATVTVAVGLALMGYGQWRLGQQTTQPGPIVGLVQQAVPISLSGRELTAEKILTDHVESTRELIGRQCDLVIWPETMLPTGLNVDMLRLAPADLLSADLRSLAERFVGPEAAAGASEEELRAVLKLCIEGGTLRDGSELVGLRQQAQQVAELAGQLGCPILAGGSTVHRNLHPIDDRDRWLVRNSALWFDQAGVGPLIYSKIHLVPFSEYVPFKKTWLWLHNALRWFVPPVMEQLDPGDGREPFVLVVPNEAKPSCRVATVICYEGTFPGVCRSLVMRDGRKQADILANMSNDGWFVYRLPGGSYQGSTEHPQHLVQYCFRAIESRVPVVRAVNTGISASIDSNGRITAELDLKLDDYKKRTMVAGTLLLDGAKTNDKEYQPGHGPQVLVDSRVTVYSLTGDVFAAAASAAAVLLVSMLLMYGRRGE